MFKTSKLINISLLAMFVLQFGYAQDIHHSQFYTSPLNMNPALTGVFNGDVRVAANLRKQWFVDDLVNYMTITGSVDKRFFPKKWTTKGMFSGGILFNYDRAGDSRLSLGHLGISGAYAYPLNARNIVSVGALLGGSSRRFSLNELTWDNQYSWAGHDPTIPSIENFTSTSKTFLDLGAGLNYRWQKSKRTKVDAGVGLFHLNQPEQRFSDNSPSSKLPMRMNFSLTPSFQMTQKIDLLLHGQYQKQTVYNEALVGAYGKFYLATKRGKEMALLLGVATRLQRDLIPKIAIEFNQWYAGLSYDINSSPWKKATNRRGGPEFSLIHTFTKSRPLSALKACPIL